MVSFHAKMVRIRRVPILLEYRDCRIRAMRLPFVASSEPILSKATAPRRPRRCPTG